ncbi:ribosome assembly cofactor RimP [Abyssalbus ytuae]|uniref:Ribosome maturation factor RimP n=1 Tax=Abyssalbus ytuae TaxID=2926907 RepID=A0A9E7D4J8_9FLAO|nr:ribosome assembly cofactor RimP [Abyssalbus ytuae]UOB19014.1 ribosome assembly cofactor RimP [Abyssalbus ytuae]
MLKDKVEALLEQFFLKRKDLFLLDLNISPDNKIRVIIDGDNGVTLNDCIDASRQVEHNLDRDEEDFSLEVTSAGATEPIVNNRQYLKNIGRKLKVSTRENKFEGTLTQVTDKGIFLEWKVREAKPVGKGKVTVEKKEQLLFENIVEAKVKITF